MVTPRDFATLTAATFNKETGSAAVLSKSIIHKSIPEEKGFVRGQLLNTGYIIEPTDGTRKQSNVTYIVQIDPKGWIPMPIVAAVSKQQPLTLARLRNFIVQS